MCTGNGILERKTIEKWEWDFNSSNRKAGIVEFELGFEKEKNNLLGNGILCTGNGIHERKTIEKWEWDFNSSNRIKMNKSASTGGFSLLMKLFIQVYENK